MSRRGSSSRVVRKAVKKEIVPITELVACPVYTMIKKVRPKDENGNLAVDENGNALFKYYKYASTGDIECKLNDEYMNEDEKSWSYKNTKAATSENISSNPKYLKAYIDNEKNKDESLEFIYIACKEDGFIKRGDIKKGFNCLDISSICPLIARGATADQEGKVEKHGNVYYESVGFNECTLPAHSIHDPETDSLYCKEGYYASGDATVKYECLACPSESKTDWLEKNPGGNYPTECPETGSASQQETTENADGEGDASSENDGTTNNDNTAFDGIISIDGGEKMCDNANYKGQGTYTKDLTKTEELVCVKSNITITENDCWVSEDGSLKAEFTNKDKDGKEVDYYYCKCPQYEGRQMLGDGLKTIDASSSNHYCQLVKTWLVATQKMQEAGPYPEGYEICNNTINALPFNKGYEGTKVPRGCIPDCGEGNAWLPIDDNAK